MFPLPKPDDRSNLLIIKGEYNKIWCGDGTEIVLNATESSRHTTIEGFNTDRYKIAFCAPGGFQTRWEKKDLFLSGAAALKILSENSSSSGDTTFTAKINNTDPEKVNTNLLDIEEFNAKLQQEKTFLEKHQFKKPPADKTQVAPPTSENSAKPMFDSETEKAFAKFSSSCSLNGSELYTQYKAKDIRPMHLKEQPSLPAFA